ncbi:acyl carrier protein [Prochlorococcus marinus]|uniref:acyl carrier protein n=1 Tax=Prochlorococcus marinus TaxID=1219 RepID=UPI0007B38C79|nr:phosphopantetheine-binding protein [Prochlorococcus marinus]KZR78113.1 hypothetical protein PMIT1320_00195 [Prochlorococcus marinus str. MIT 1320]
MTDKEIFKQVAGVIEKVVKTNVNRESSMENTKEWDSMAQLQVLIRLESTFEVEFDLRDLNKATSVRGWYDALLKAIKDKKKCF